MPTINAAIVAGVSADQPSVILYALREATRLHAAVRIVHCGAPLAGAAVLERARLVVAASGVPAEVEYVTEAHDPATWLEVEARSAHVIVVGADDVTWLDQMLGGEVSGHLALNAACPVVVVPREIGRSGAARGVVVTLDGDTSSAGPLRYGFEQADFRVEKLMVLHAAPVGTTQADTAALTAKMGREVARWNAQAPHVQAQLSVTNGDAWADCMAATAKASLLVIGRPHGHAYSFALTRPVAMLVLREARCPVAIVPAHYGSDHYGSDQSAR